MFFEFEVLATIVKKLISCELNDTYYFRNCYKLDRSAKCNEGEPNTVDLKSACA